MKRVDLIRHLERNGCVLEREGRRHSVYRHPTKNSRTTVPRHREVDEKLARKICEKDLGIPAP